MNDDASKLISTLCEFLNCIVIKALSICMTFIVLAILSATVQAVILKETNVGLSPTATGKVKPCATFDSIYAKVDFLY